MTTSRRLLAFTLLTFAPFTAFAHPSVLGEVTFLGAFLHPLTGPDHVAFALLLGLWATRRGGHSGWLAAAVFGLGLLAGGWLANQGFQLAFFEWGIGASLAVVALLAWQPARLPLAAAISLLGLCAIFHGQAHAGLFNAEAGYGLAILLGSLLPFGFTWVLTTNGGLAQRGEKSGLNGQSPI